MWTSVCQMVLVVMETWPASKTASTLPAPITVLVEQVTECRLMVVQPAQVGVVKHMTPFHCAYCKEECQLNP